MPENCLGLASHASVLYLARRDHALTFCDYRLDRDSGQGICRRLSVEMLSSNIPCCISTSEVLDLQIRGSSMLSCTFKAGPGDYYFIQYTPSD